MDPISNQIFSYDFERFVLQKQNIPLIPHNTIDPPKFDINATSETKKTKKDLAKKKQKKSKENYKNPFFK